MHRLLNKYGLRIEELILVILIALNILDFFEILPGDLDYVKKIISWTVLGYILYKIDLTKILFGTSHRNLDLILIASYFLLTIKNLTAYALASVHETNYLHSFYDLMIANAGVIEAIGFYIGGIAILIIAFYYATRFPVTAPSLMHVIHEEGEPPRHLGKLATRFITILFVLIGFFVVVFNLMMEWLGIAIDAPLVMVGIFFYVFHTKRFNPDGFIYKIGTVGEGFYQKFISLFKYKHTLLMGIAGMLVLHLLTDIGNFIVPYILTIKDPLYFSQLGAGHTPLITLFMQSITTSAIQNLGTGLVYLLNVIGALMLLVLPAYFWYDSYIGKKIGLKRWILSLFATSITTLVLNPAFRLERITKSSIAGVDILTQPIRATGAWYTLAVALFFGMLCYVFSFRMRRQVEMLCMATALSFFGYYLYNFFINVFNHYVVSTVMLLKGATHTFIALFFFMFLMITIIFYIGGFLIFIVEIVKSYFSL